MNRPLSPHNKRSLIAPINGTIMCGYDPGDFEKLVYFHGSQNDIPLGEFVRQFKGLSSTSKAKQITSTIPGYRLVSDIYRDPITNSKNEIVNLQFISDDGTKRCLKGGQKKGCYFIIGTDSTTIYICEGYATGASLHEHTGSMVVIALDAGNMESVAKRIKSLHLHYEIIIAADNDESGTGQRYAEQAALAIGAQTIIPLTTGTDFNDYLTTGSLIEDLL
jgi:phage/plasmid primase-like uncharacterized protein